MVVVRGTNQKLKTEWFIKPIASGRMLNWHSCHQLKHKLNVANNFIERIAFLSRNDENQDIFQIIRKYLTQNNYPTKLINRMINTNKKIQQRKSQQRTNEPYINHHLLLTDHINPNSNKSPTSSTINLDQSSKPHNNTGQNQSSTNNSALHQPDSIQTPIITTLHHNPLADSASDPETSHSDIPKAIHPPENKESSDNISSTEIVYRSVPYIPLLTERLIQCLATDYPNVRIASRRNLTVGDLHTRVKDPKRIGEKSNVVYQIPCEEPCPCVYIGLTKNTLDQRLSGHRSNMKVLATKQDRNVNNTTATNRQKEKDNTALIEHILETGHTFNLDKTIVLDSSFNKHTLNFLEMCHIFNTNNTVNQRTDVNNLNTIFASVLDILHKHNYKKPYVKNTDSHKETNAKNTDSHKTPQEETML